jgi:serine/threonine protein phosphatase PrpC
MSSESEFPSTPEKKHFEPHEFIGFRDEQQDRVNTHVSHINSDKSQLLKFFCVHDGHSGTQAVEELKTMVEEKWNEIKGGENLMLDPPKNIADDTNVKLLADLYTEAHKKLEEEKSGVVSITALSIKNSAVYFSWIGDCEGCFFLDDPLLKDPLYHCPRDYVGTIDFAELEVEYVKEFIAETPQHVPACSTPHSFMSGMQDKIKFPRGSHHSTHTQKHVFHVKEIYTPYEKIVPNFFPNVVSRNEFELAKLFNQKRTTRKKGKKYETTMDIMIHKVGNATLTSDARYSGAIQPTRSIGDSGKSNYSIIRFPTVMRFWFPNPPTPDLRDHCHILLCCDGFFSEYAFSGISGLCRFLVNPDAFFTESFYCRGQVLTECLITAKLLPPNLEKVQDIHKYPLYKAWKKCKDWDEIKTFITTQHMHAVKSEEFINVLSDGEVRDHNKWLDTCDMTIASLHIAWDTDDYKDMTRNIAPFMAVLMGSRDNVTLVTTKAFT